MCIDLLHSPNLIQTLIVLITCYLIGGIPFGLLIVKVFSSKDLRTEGSGNIGATNALRTGGLKVGLLTFLFDSLKAYIPTLVALHIYGPEIASFAVLGTVLGHLFPLYLKFNGGKGIATFLSALLAFSFTAGIILYLTWIAVAFIWRYSSLASLTMAFIAPFWISYFIPDTQCIHYIVPFLSLLIILKHHENILRLVKGEETKIKLKK